MRAIVIEFAGGDDHALRGILPGEAARALEPGPVARGEGSLSGERSGRYDPSHGEPV
jgi:hypothetical protein